MSISAAYFLVISMGAVLLGLGWADKRRKIKINKLGLGFAVWLVVLALMAYFALPSVLMFM